MAPGSAAAVWKSLDGYQLSTGEHYTINEQVIFHNEGFAEYFVDFTLDLKQYETIFGAQLGLISYLSLYVHTSKDEFVGFARSGSSSSSKSNLSFTDLLISDPRTADLGMWIEYRSSIPR